MYNLSATQIQTLLGYFRRDSHTDVLPDEVQLVVDNLQRVERQASQQPGFSHSSLLQSDGSILDVIPPENMTSKLYSRATSPTPSGSSEDIPLSLTLSPNHSLLVSDTHPPPTTSPTHPASTNTVPTTPTPTPRPRQKRPAPTTHETCSQKLAKLAPPAKTNDWRSHRGGQKHKSSASKSEQEQLAREDADDFEDEELNTDVAGEWMVVSRPAPPPREIEKWVQEKLARIANARECNLESPECVRWIQSLAQSIRGECIVDSEMFQKNDLRSLALRCERSTVVGHAVSFIDIVNRINFACKVDSAETFSGLVQTGLKFARLISSASIYFIIVIIMCRKQYMLGRSHELYITALSNALRDRSSCDPNTQLLISQRLVHLLSYIRNIIPLSFATMFSSQLLQTYNLPNTISCHDLSESDSFFDAIKRESFTLRDRNMQVWKNFTEPLAPHLTSASLHNLNRQLLISTPSSSSDPTTRAPSPCSDSDDKRGPQAADFDSETGKASGHSSIPCETIDTGFNFAAKENRVKPYSGVKNRVAWDVEERKISEAASKAETYVKYKDVLSRQYDSRGVKKCRESYLYCKQDWIQDKDARYNGTGSDLAALVCGTLPESIRSRLEGSLISTFTQTNEKDVLRELDSAAGGPQPPGYHCVQFDYFVRSGTSGKTAPEDVHPDFLRRNGKSKTNHTHFIPRVSKEIMENEHAYNVLCEVFQDLFVWVREKILLHASEYCEDLLLFADVLPGREVSPVHPFSGVVINLNVVTFGHRDEKDLQCCLVIPIGNFEGGELVLVELGLVFELKNGDMILFPSCSITHLNLHYCGRRGSLVLHSDRAGLVYGKRSRNGWKDKGKFR